MADVPRRPRYQDIQAPRLHLTGAALRRGYALGPAATREEERFRKLLEDEPPVGSDPDGEEVTRFQPGRPLT